MMKFCADISPLDIECWILDIHHLVCQTPRDPAGGDRRGARFERTSRGMELHSIRGEPRGHDCRNWKDGMVDEWKDGAAVQPQHRRPIYLQPKT